MRFMKQYLVKSIIILSFILHAGLVSAEETEWNLSFCGGYAAPTGDLSDAVESDYSIGLAVEIMPTKLMGARIFYSNRKFALDDSSEDLTLNTFSIDAVAAYSFPGFVRIFALIGPTYFSAEGQEDLGLGQDGKDIGWNGGLGFEIYPLESFGIQMQSIYYSGEIGNKSLRMTWVDSTLGVVFRF